MVSKLARMIKHTPFSALLAYVLVLNVLLAGFAQASSTDRMLDGGIEICVTNPVTGQTGTGQQPANNSAHDCQMCCLAAHQPAWLPFVSNAITARLGINLPVLLPVETRGHPFGPLGSAQARAPPIG